MKVNEFLKSLMFWRPKARGGRGGKASVGGRGIAIDGRDGTAPRQHTVILMPKGVRSIVVDTVDAGGGSDRS